MMDVRFLVLGAVLADAIDLPVGIFTWSTFQTPRMVGHSMVFAVAVMVVVGLFTRRGPIRKKWILLAVGLFLHLALDAMWRLPETLWWPFFGWDFAPSGFETFSSYAGSVMTSPRMWLGELAGLAYLVFLWRKSHLSSRDAWQQFTSAGIVSAPIERS
jgi:hypothetical protein